MANRLIVSSKKEIEARSETAFKAGVSASLRANTDLVPGWGGSPDVVTTRDFRLFRDWFAQAGETLADRLRSAGPGIVHLPLLIQLTRAVAFAHREGLVRLGIEAASFNPANVDRTYREDGNVGGWCSWQ